MDIVISLVECDGGMWNISRNRVVLFRQLRLAPAIKLARELARDEHHRCGRSVRVHLPGPHAPIVLAQYRTTAAAA